MEMYIFESGRIADQFIDSFLHASEKGVEVFLLLDDFGSRGLVAGDRRRLLDGGVRLVFHNPLRFGLLKNRFKKNLRRTHRKYLVVDGHTAYVGGAAISDDFVGEQAWHDCMLELHGSGASDWQALFAADLKRWSGDVSMPAPAVVENVGEASGRLVYTSGGVRLPLKRILLNRMRHAQQRIWLASAYFIPSSKIRRALRRAALRGRDVRLLLPGPVTDHPAVRHASRRYYARLLRHGIRIFEYQDQFMHSKVVLADDWCTIGSSNMDRWNFRWNLEANEEIDDAELAATVKDVFSNDFDRSEEIDGEAWLRRAWLQRAREWLWGRVDLWLTGWRSGA